MLVCQSLLSKDLVYQHFSPRGKMPGSSLQTTTALDLPVCHYLITISETSQIFDLGATAWLHGLGDRHVGTFPKRTQSNYP